VIPFEFRHDLWRQKTSHGAIAQCYLRDPMFTVLIQYQSVTDTQTDRHTTTAYTAISIAFRGKNLRGLASAIPEIWMGPPQCTRGPVMAERPCDTLVSRNSATTVQNIRFENWSPGPITWHYLRDPTFIRFHTIPEFGRHACTDRRTDRYTMTACIASHGKNRLGLLHCIPSIITRQRASVDSKLLGTP